MEHSRLLKFLVPARDSTEMAETPSFKIQYDYQNPNNVESEVPGSQNIREVTEARDDADGAKEIQNVGYTITQSSYTEQSETVEGVQITRTTVTLSTSSTSEELVREEQTEVTETTHVQEGRPKTKIPKLMFRAAADKVKSERRNTRAVTEHETHIPLPTQQSKLSRHSKIPPPTSKPIVLKRDNEEATTKPDEEFEKIYEEIVENTQTEIEVTHPEIIESKFEEIIHDYDENNVKPINVEKIRPSRIPALRRRSTEHAETKSIISDRPKSRSLPRLKEISMRVKADNEGLEQIKYSRSVSTEKPSKGGQKSVVQTRIIQKPDVETRISKFVTTETVTSGNELNTVEGASKSVTVHRTVSVTSQGEAAVIVDKKISHSETLQTENILKGSIKIGYPTFETKISENNQLNNGTVQISEVTENSGIEDVTSDDNKTEFSTESNISETTNTTESRSSKVSVSRLASNYETVSGSKDIISRKILSDENGNTVEITELSPTVKRTRITSSSSDNGQLAIENSVPKVIERKFVENKSKIPTVERSTSVTRVVSSNNISVKEVNDLKASATQEINNVATITTEQQMVGVNANTQAVTTETRSVNEIDTKSRIEEIDGGITKITTVRKLVDVQNKTPTIDRSTSITRVVSSKGSMQEVNDINATNKQETINVANITTEQQLVGVNANIQAITTKIQEGVNTESKTNEIEGGITKITTVRKIVDVQNKIPTIDRSTSITRVVSSNNASVKGVDDIKASAIQDRIETITTEQKLVGNAVTKTEIQTVKEIDTKSQTNEIDGGIKKVTTVRKIVDVQNRIPTIDRSTSMTGVVSSKESWKGVNDFKASVTRENKKMETITTEQQLVGNAIVKTDIQAVRETDTASKTNENIRKIVDVKNETPSLDRSTSITRVVTSKGSMKEVNNFKASATQETNNVATITSEQQFIGVNANTQAITTEIQAERELETESRTKEIEGGIRKVTTVRKIVDIQNKSPTIERSVSVTRITESNNAKPTEMEGIKTLVYEKDSNIEKNIATNTTVSALTKQIETQENSKETFVSKRDASLETYEVTKKANVEDVAVTGKVEKLRYNFGSNDVTNEVTKDGQFDDMPKKKSILSKIAMFERQDVEVRMPKKKPEKLVLKNTPHKAAHLHTPTIVDEVLKSHENTPLTANSNKDFSRLKIESVSTQDYRLSTDVKQTGDYRQSVSVTTSQKDNCFTQSESVTEVDYKVRADEVKQTVEMSKVSPNLAANDFKGHILTSDYTIHDIKHVGSKLEQDYEVRKDITSYDVSSIKSDLVSSTLEHKYNVDVKDRSLQYETINKTEDNLASIANNNRGDYDITPEPPKRYDNKFKSVHKLTSEYERRADVNKITISTKDLKTDAYLKRDPYIIDYKFDMNKHINQVGKRIETSKQISVTDTTKDSSLTHEQAATLDYKFAIDVEKQNTDNDIYDASDEKRDLGDESFEENPPSYDPQTIEYTFRDVKKLATEYEERVKCSKKLAEQSRAESLNSLNYDSKYMSLSTEILGKIMTDAPVIFVTPKLDEPTEPTTNNNNDNVEISTTRVKEAVANHEAKQSETKFMKQISTDYKEAKIGDKKILDTQNTYYNVYERSSSLIGERKSVSSPTINLPNPGFTPSSPKITVNWVPKGAITSESSYNKITSEHNLSKISSEGNLSKITSEIQTGHTIVDTVQEDSTEVKIKPKGYVIRREGDLAYARIQEEAEYGDEIRTFEEVAKLPRTPINEGISIVNKKLKNVDEKKKYYADVDINTVMKGKVSRMISRMTSHDTLEADKKNIDVKEMPRRMSVLEKIAMFEVSESKSSSGRMEYSFSRTRHEKARFETYTMSQEEFEERVTDLKSARLLYGRIEEVPHVVLRNGVEMPVLALGTAMLDTRLLPYIIGAAIDLGYRAIDTAYIYGNEKEIGEAIKAKIEDGTVRREELFIISKLWSTFHRTELVEKACRSSLEAMGLDYFDLYLIHNPMSFKEGGDPIPKIATVVQYSQSDYLDAWFGMEQLMSKGLARSVGVSNFNSSQLQRILDKGKMKPVVNQVECHPYLSQQKLDSFCEDRDITLSCFGVLGSKGTPAEYKSTLPPAIDDPLVQVMASGLNVSPAQLLIRYQLDSGRTAVVKSSNAKHLWDNLQALTFYLTEGQVEALHALNRNKRTFTFKGMGDTHKNYPFKIPY